MLRGEGSDDVVGGIGEVGEAVGQAGAGEDQVVGVVGFGDAELGQQVQVLAQGLQFFVGFEGQVVAGVAVLSVRHGGSPSACVVRGVPAGASCARKGVGRVEATTSWPGVFPRRVFYSAPSRRRTDCVGSARCIGHKKPT